MTSQVDEAIARANTERAGALIGYLPAGFPDLSTSIEAAIALAENGVDVIELGIPYSDPVMDGPAIQVATQHALAAGFRLSDGFTAVREITRAVRVPVLMMSYFNPVLQYGIERFADDLRDAGGAGLITPDLIPDEGAEWISASRRTGLDRIFLAAPSSSDARLTQAVNASTGFVYAVSTMGITGARADVDRAARSVVERLRSAHNPLAGTSHACVGIGISTADQVREVLNYADGAIVGSALVNALTSDGIAGVTRVARDLASGTRPAADAD